jgi:hypothetical protein
MKRSILSLALALLCISATAFAQGGTTVTKYDFSNPYYYNPCCDEIISLTGTVHSSIKTTLNADGTTSYRVIQNVSGVKGTGQTTGINYNASENLSVSQTVDLSDGLPYSFDQKFTTRLVGKGKGGKECSFRVTFTAHFAIDADGNVVSSITNVEFDCSNGTLIN